MGIACWIPRTTDKHSEYFVHIPLPLKQWWYENVSMLLYMYIACLDLLKSFELNTLHFLFKQNGFTILPSLILHYTLSAL